MLSFFCVQKDWKPNFFGGGGGVEYVNLNLPAVCSYKKLYLLG